MKGLSIVRIIRISRPRFWLYELGTFLIGVLAATGVKGSFFSPEVIVFCLFFLFPANLLIYGINDIYDYETDMRNPKKTGYEDVLSKDLHKKLQIIIAILCVPFVLFSIDLSLAAQIAFFLFFLFAVFYSAPPIRAKARPYFDSFFSAGHYVATGVFGYIIAGGSESFWLPVLAAMSWAIAMHAYSAVPDIHADSEAKLATIATALGGKATIVLCLALYTIAAGITFSYFGPLTLLWYLQYLYMMVRSYNASEAQLFTLYTYFPYINALVGMALFFSILFTKGWL
jgi:lycopene elongase/hydratase (dihydrobisanhydrobacterioruberin-forming)